MSDLTKFSEGASILQQVDVSDIFKNLALGIAEAQQKLDDNSIAQAIKLAETKIDGKSLLTLGFVPVFYAFQYADISASINLRMGLKEAVEFGFGIDIQLSNQKGYSADNRNFMSENKYSETEQEYKSSRDLNFRAGERNSVTIENESFSLKEDLKAKSRIEQFKEDIFEKATNVEQIYDVISSQTLTSNQSRGVDVWVDTGYLRVEESLHYKQNGGVALLKITDYQGNDAIDVNGSSGANGAFTLGANFDACLVEAALPATGTGMTIYGMSKSGDLYIKDGTWKLIPNKFYFGYNSDKITYDEDLKQTGETDVNHPAPISGFQNKNHDKHVLIHKVLRLIQRQDPKALITITGVTDPKGGDSPQNKSLAKRRAEKLRGHIFGTSNAVNVKVGAATNPEGVSDLNDRYAKVELNADYIIFLGTGTGTTVTKTATPDKTATLENKFVYADDLTAGQFDKLQVKYGSTALSYSVDAVEKSFTTLTQYVKATISDNTYEELNNRHYFLEDQSIVKFHLYSSESEEIQIQHEDESESEGTENSNSFLSSKSKNEKSLLSESTNNKSQSSSFALGAHMDFRMSRQFEMSMEGNSAMSARLISLPAPDAFRDFLEAKYGTGTTEG